MAKGIEERTLVSMGVITAGELEHAESTAREQDYDSTLVYLLSEGTVTNAQVHAAWAWENEVGFVDLEADPVVAEELVPLVPAFLARRFSVVPVALEGTVLSLASSDPTSEDLRTSLAGALPRYSVRLVYAARQAITKASAAAYSAEGEAASVARATSLREAEIANATSGLGGALGLLAGNVEDEDVAKIVQLIIEQGVKDGASDIHLDPQPGTTMVRYRVDGLLRDASGYPAGLTSQMVSRVKVLAGMDSSERRVPQDGRMSVVIDASSYDLRVATFPAVLGEKVTMRILAGDTSSSRLEDLGFGGDNLERYRRCFTRPNGLVVLTGPTGSGKTTTLYSTLNELATRAVNVVTVEDPVEIRVPGINQVEVDVKVGRTFPSVLRSFLRNDPDVILVGEIRDPETAEIAVDASQTGHMVLTTLHTNDAPSAVVRLTKMGIAPHMVGSSLTCVLAQRLCRRLCTHCRVQVEAADVVHRVIVSAGLYAPEDDAERTVYTKVGCGRCSGTGYKGRVAIHEVMEVTDKIEALASESASSLRITEAAKGDGMRSLLSDGWDRVLQGTTTVEEILRVASA